MFQRKNCTENQNAYFMFSKFFLQKLCCLLDNVEKCDGTAQATCDYIIQHMHFACWITKATDTHSEYVILIAFPWQQWLHEHTSVLRLYAHCLSCYNCVDCKLRLKYIFCCQCRDQTDILFGC
jgi:hypothetical protein